MMILAVLVITVAYGSLLEWFVHGVVFHRWFPRLHAPHHAEFHGAEFQRPGPYRNLQRWWLEPAAIALHAPLLVVLPRPIAITALVALTAYAYATNVLHSSIHCPDDRWLERTVWHRRLVERHRVHHRHAGSNLAVATPLADYVMRTARPAAAPPRTATPARSSAPRS